MKPTNSRTAIKIVFFLLVIVLFSSSILANGDVNEPTSNLEESIKGTILKVIIYAVIALSVLILISIYGKSNVEGNSAKIILFTLIVLVTVIATVYTAGATIYLNVISETKGPVHWHGDFEVWNCGTKLDLADPHGLSNRIGTSTFHEHGDDRIHIEGVVIRTEDINLHNFFHRVGATLEQDSLQFPTNEGTVNLKTGDTCNGQPGELQVFLYKVKNPYRRNQWAYEQTKLPNFEDYVLSPEQNVPPGDCIIVEFDIVKDTTDKMCESYRVSEGRGDLSGG